MEGKRSIKDIEYTDTGEPPITNCQDKIKKYVYTESW